MPSPTTFAAALDARLRGDPTAPLVTFYDDATGERVELSVTTYANWVAKTAGLLGDELDVGRGATVLLDLPVHWLAPVWLGAALTVGAALAAEPGDAPVDLVVCGPDGVLPAPGRYADLAARVPVVALSLAPLGRPFEEPLPPGVVDYGAVVLGQPDVFVPLDPPGGDDPAWRGPGAVSQAGLLAECLAQPRVRPGGRLLTDASPTRRETAVAFLGPLLAGGGVVLERNGTLAEERYAAERATDRWRAPGQPARS